MEIPTPPTPDVETSTPQERRRIILGQLEEIERAMVEAAKQASTIAEQGDALGAAKFMRESEALFRARIAIVRARARVLGVERLREGEGKDDAPAREALIWQSRGKTA